MIGLELALAGVAAAWGAGVASGVMLAGIARMRRELRSMRGG